MSSAPVFFPDGRQNLFEATFTGYFAWCGMRILEMGDGAAVVEFTDLLTAKDLLKGYPTGMRVIVRRERPHPGAQLRFDDVDGYRLTALGKELAENFAPLHRFAERWARG